MAVLSIKCLFLVSQRGVKVSCLVAVSPLLNSAKKDKTDFSSAFGCKLCAKKEQPNEQNQVVFSMQYKCSKNKNHETS
jgi:hypothetical protein